MKRCGEGGGRKRLYTCTHLTHAHTHAHTCTHMHTHAHTHTHSCAHIKTLLVRAQEFHFRALQTDVLEVEVRNSGRKIRQFWGKVKAPLDQFLRWRGTT